MADKQLIAEKLKEKAPKGKISCHEARLLAQEMQIEPATIGELCDVLKIKICSCELGCF